MSLERRQPIDRVGDQMGRSGPLGEGRSVGIASGAAGTGPDSIEVGRIAVGDERNPTLDCVAANGTNWVAVGNIGRIR
jgi:hypothetical protein